MQPNPSPAPVPENRHKEFSDRVEKLCAFEKAAEYVGQDRLAAMIGIAPRSLRAKLQGTRPLSDADLATAAGAVARVASEMLVHATRMRVLSGFNNGR